jgi:CheY-like chemotaxis protein
MTEQASSPQRERSSVVVKVLYIEDNDDDVYMLKMRLELLGNFEVLTAEDGEKGCAVAAAEQPDIILMDLEMAVVDGWEAARSLKGNPQTQDIQSSLCPHMRWLASARKRLRRGARSSTPNRSNLIVWWQPFGGY